MRLAEIVLRSEDSKISSMIALYEASTSGGTAIACQSDQVIRITSCLTI